MAVTGNDIVKDVRAEVIEPMPAFFSQDRMLDLINLAQREYVRETRCLESIVQTNSVLGQPDYPMPPNFLGSMRVYFNNIQNGVDQWQPLTPTSLEKISQEFPNFLNNITTLFQIPFRYYIIATTLYLYPTPNVTGTTNNVKMVFESKPINLLTLDDPISIDDSLVPGIRAYVLWKLWAQDNEDTKAEAQHQLYLVEVGKGRAWKKRRQLDSRVSLDVQSPYTPSYGNINTNGMVQGINPLNM